MVLHFSSCTLPSCLLKVSTLIILTFTKVINSYYSLSALPSSLVRWSACNLAQVIYLNLYQGDHLVFYFSWSLDTSQKFVFSWAFHYNACSLAFKILYYPFSSSLALSWLKKLLYDIRVDLKLHPSIIIDENKGASLKWHVLNRTIIQRIS